VPHLKDDKVARHFAHFRRAENCVARETYLHRAAKALFIRTYRSCLSSKTSYVLNLPVKNTCTALQAELGFTCEVDALSGYDLTQWYESVEEEGTAGSFRADVLLRSSAATWRPLLVEFAVTHPCEPAKLAAGALILEIGIKEESDLQKLLVPHLTAAAQSRITAHNFRPRSEVRALCGRNCPRQVKVMVVHSSGVPKLFTVAAGKATAFAPKTAVWKKVLTKFEAAAPGVDLDQLEYVGNDLPKGENLLERGCFAALLDGASVTNCYVCRHRGTTFLVLKGLVSSVSRGRAQQPCAGMRALCAHSWGQWATRSASAQCSMVAATAVGPSRCDSLTHAPLCQKDSLAGLLLPRKHVVVNQYGIHVAATFDHTYHCQTLGKKLIPPTCHRFNAQLRELKV
jgi:hypothetical protein